MASARTGAQGPDARLLELDHRPVLIATSKALFHSAPLADRDVLFVQVALKALIHSTAALAVRADEVDLDEVTISRIVRGPPVDDPPRVVAAGVHRDTAETIEAASAKAQADARPFRLEACELVSDRALVVLRDAPQVIAGVGLIREFDTVAHRMSRLGEVLTDLGSK